MMELGSLTRRGTGPEPAMAKDELLARAISGLVGRDRGKRGMLGKISSD